nr:hypothetical protein [Bacteroidales bacterium]
MFIEILKISIPALLLMITIIVVLKQIHKKEIDIKKIEQISRNQKLITPLRLQSYERLILFLERIGPNHLIIRVQQPNMSALELQKSMLANIRTEYEHNLSQQLY